MSMFKKDISFPEAEQQVIEFWDKNQSFLQCMKDAEKKKAFIFYDGPPFATGLPHYGHILSGTVKDTIGRYQHQQGFRVSRRFGWDCHGLPVEYEIDKMLNITDRNQVLEMGIDKYNEKCKEIVMRYASEWESTVIRMGRWVDFKRGFKTMDTSFMESTWFIFKQLWMRNKIYRGFKVMPFSTACKTPLSNFEASQNYKDVSDPSVLVAFPLKKQIRNKNVSLVAWTTTPWTLPSNCGLIVNRKVQYGIFEHKGKHYAISVNRIEDYFKDAKVIDVVEGEELIGLEYSQPFDFFESHRSKGFFRVIAAEFVSDTNGTAIVHCAPAFGEEDYQAFVSQGLIKTNDEVPCPVDENGCFTLGSYKGLYVKDLDKIVLEDIKDRILLNNRIVHSYPFCWRSDTPLIYKLVPNWFVKVKESKDVLLKNNEMINWVPEDIKYKRFHNWLAQARDWAISRNRFWGTPLPVWTTEDYSESICIGSIQELEELSGKKVSDLHRQFIDDIVIEKDGKKFRRIEEVLDCWFESGSMPYSQDHWPFETNEVPDLSNLNISDDGHLKKSGFPAQFIGEGLDQTRGWFYTLHVISSLLFDKPAFENVIVTGIVLASDGKKMSKRLKNYPDPNQIFKEYGADSLRMYLISSPVVEADNLRFSEKGVKEIMKTLLIPWYNSLSFLMDCDRREQQTIEMDEWIISSFNTFCHAITSSVSKYRLNGVLGLALKFIDDLSNWYIRMNRQQLRAGAKLLSKILEDFSVVMAPFTPFFSEYCYQSIVDSKKSVHQIMYPVTEPSTHPFEKTKNVIEGFRQIRDRLKLQVKRPIKMAKIICSESFKSAVTGFIDNIQTECNILEVVFDSPANYSYTTKVNPFFENLKKDMSSMKKKISIIKGLNDGQIAQLVEGSVEVDGTIILSSDVLIIKEFDNVENSQNFVDFGLIVDVEINEEVKRLADAREFYSFLQKLRKSAGLVTTDHVLVQMNDEYLKEIVSKKYPEVAFGAGNHLVIEKSYQFGDADKMVRLYKD